MNVGVTGHQDLPASAIEYITEGIATILSAIPSNLLGISCLAEGADQLFAEAVINAGGRLHVVVPCQNYQHSFTSSKALERYKQFENLATSIELLNFDNPSETAFMHGGRRVVELSEMLLAVWDGMSSRGRGGTADIVHYATTQGKLIEVIWPKGLSR